MLGEIKAFSDNVVVRSTLSYIFTTRGPRRWSRTSR